MEILTVKTNNNEIEYFSFGNGSKNMVIIPGLSVRSVMLSADAIANAYSMFCDEYTVYVFENIYDGYTLENMTDDVALAMIELGINDAYVFSASQGAMIAQIMAIKYPNLIKKMILASTVSRINDTLYKNIEAWVSFAKNNDIVALNHSFFSLVYSKETIDSIGDAIIELEKLGTSDEMSIFAKIASACFDFDIYDDIDKIQCPTLVIGGMRDRVLTGDASLEIANKLNCELYMYENGEHAVYDEASDYKDRIYNFFKD